MRIRDKLARSGCRFWRTGRAWYLARRVTEAELVKRSPFMMLVQELPQAREHMGRFAMAMAQQSDGSFVLLATERNLLVLNRASAEELQDHQCDILN